MHKIMHKSTKSARACKNMQELAKFCEILQEAATARSAKL